MALPIPEFDTREIRMNIFAAIAAGVNGTGGFTGSQRTLFMDIKVELIKFYIKYISPGAHYIGFAGPCATNADQNHYGALLADDTMTFLDAKYFIVRPLERVDAESRRIAGAAAVLMTGERRSQFIYRTNEFQNVLDGIMERVRQG